jgi:hypothetical protein
MMGMVSGGLVTWPSEFSEAVPARRGLEGCLTRSFKKKSGPTWVSKVKPWKERDSQMSAENCMIEAGEVGRLLGGRQVDKDRIVRGMKKE